ncbi:MAG: S49 family peptidase [Oscillospiraceae bacterium]|jgi:ClpP class serine protease|nr:S49 family peptidase [Oscillospiraceae bacterium]
MFHKFSKLEVVAHPFFITQNALQAYLMPIATKMPASFYFDEIPSAKNVAKKQAAILSEETKINLTTDYGNTELQKSLAYYEAHGTLMFDDYSWYFNTKEFLKDFPAAEANPAILAHFLHINSGGGLAYYLDEVHKVLSTRSKPLIAQCEMYMCSAALYLGAPADKIYATTPFDTLGSIGTMVSFWDLKPYFEKAGFKWHEHYASQSTLKNKRINDLLEGKPDDYIKHELDPLAEQFIVNIKKSRKKADGDDLFAGQTYYADEAVEMKLIDGIQPVEASIIEAYEKGKEHAEKQRLQNLINPL